MNSPKQLAVVATHLRPSRGFGGVAESTSELILAWSAAGKPLEVVVSDGTRGPPISTRDFEKELNAKVSIYSAVKLPWALKWGFGFGAPWCIGMAIWRSDIVYISGIATWPTTLAALFARVFKRPYIVALRGGLMAEHWHEIVTGRPIKALYYQLFVFPTLRGARGVHVTTALEAAPLAELEPLAKVIIVPNAFSPPSSRTISGPSHIRDGLVLIFLGRLAAEKGILGFAERFAAIRQPNDRLLIAGPCDGAYGESVVSLCANTQGFEYLGIIDRVTIPHALQSAHALVLPSGVDGDIRENFGNVVVESLLHNRPAFVTRGLAWDDLEVERIGALFDRSLCDLELGLEAIRQLAIDDSVWRRAGIYAQEKFSPAAVASTLWQALVQDDQAKPRRASDGLTNRFRNRFGVGGPVK